MNRATKIIVFTSNLCAGWLLARLVSRGVPPIMTQTVLAFAVSALAAFVAGDLAVTVLLSITYFVPALTFRFVGQFGFGYNVIWLAALCGAMLPRSLRSSWAYPGRFRAPLVLWALVLALGWPIVVLRELDFVPALINRGNLWNSRVPVSPQFAVSWITSVAAIAMTGLLLLDWLFVVYPADEHKRFESRVAWPMFAGAVVAAVVAVYQAFVDITFLNRTLFGALGRATGTMRDANAFGTAAALWVPVSAVLAIFYGRSVSSVRPYMAWPRVAAACGAFMVLAIAVWASGSRTALLALLVGVAVLVAALRSSLTARRTVAAVMAVAALVLTVTFAVPPAVVGPWQRAQGLLPSLALKDIRFAARQLRTRDGYGTAAEWMITQHPLVGIGVGGYYYQYADALWIVNRSERPPDNAQNWFRQQLAELGVLGSAGWLVFVGLCLVVLLRGRGREEKRPLVGATKGALVGLASASMLGVPTQDPAASLTFIVLTCWCLKLTVVDARVSPELTRREWAAVLAVLICFLGGTAYAGWTQLRPPRRAVRASYEYEYGFFHADDNRPGFRWAEKKAVTVLPGNGRWLRLVLGDVAPDAAQEPVEIKIWRNDELILRVNRRSKFPLERYVRLPQGQEHTMIQIAVARVWRPSAFGHTGDDRPRGVEVGDWVLSDRLPRGAVGIDLVDVNAGQ